MTQKAGTIWDTAQVERCAFLEGIGDVLKSLIDESISTFVNVKNHFERCAPGGIAKLPRHVGIP
jgi:hypothetical protein